MFAQKCNLFFEELGKNEGQTSKTIVETPFKKDYAKCLAVGMKNARHLLAKNAIKIQFFGNKNYIYRKSSLNCFKMF